MVNAMTELFEFNTIDDLDITLLPNALESADCSDASKEVEALKALILSEAEINVAKTAFIKQEIAEGRYQIQSNQIAEKMLADELA